MWQTIKKNKDKLLIGSGILLIFVSLLLLFDLHPVQFIQGLRKTTTVDQAGFAPIFLPEPDGVSISPNQLNIEGEIPERIVIDPINLDAPIIHAEIINAEVEGKEVVQYLVPEQFAVGWHEGSAPLGVPGNTVLSGHHNAYGKVFAGLVDLAVGDHFIVQSNRRDFEYIIANKMILPEKGEALEVRLDNAQWILPSSDERVTLVTCWPADSNTHRLILVAVPSEPHDRSAQLDPTPTPTLPVDLKTPATGLLVGETATVTPEVYIVRNAGRFSVDIRQLPAADSPIIGSFHTGEEAIATGRTADSEWIYIHYADLTGWISRELVEVFQPVETLPIVPLPTEAP